MATAYKEMARRIAPLADQVGSDTVAGDTSGFIDAFDALTKRVVRASIAPSVTPGTAENFIIMEAEADLELLSVKYHPDDALTANACDYATLDINKEDGAAGGLTSLDAITTEVSGTDDWAARVAESFGGIGVNDTLDAGEILVLQITKTGCGVAVPHGTLEVTYRLL